MKESKILSYLRRAEVVAENSPDAETKVGSILISNSTGSVISEGYNGFVRGANDAIIPKTRPAKYDFFIHAESNLICNAARNGVRTDDCFIVQTHSPCVHCARLLYQSGISTVYFKEYYNRTHEIERLGDLEVRYTPFGKYTRIDIGPKETGE
jgi:dCMP deaminase